MKKVVINKCYGYFRLSFEAFVAFLKRKDPNRKLYFYDLDVKNRCYRATDSSHGDTIIMDKDMGQQFDILNKEFQDHILSPYGIKRDDEDLIAVVEEFKDKASDKYSKLCIEQVEGPYRIVRYDGLEWIETPNSIKWES